MCVYVYGVGSWVRRKRSEGQKSKVKRKNNKVVGLIGKDIVGMNLDEFGKRKNIIKT